MGAGLRALGHQISFRFRRSIHSTKPTVLAHHPNG
jgi:hypothetical protein